MDTVATHISRALGVPGQEEEGVNEPLCADNQQRLQGRGIAKENSISALVENPRNPSKVLSACLSLLFVVIAVLVFAASAKMAIDPGTAEVSHKQMHAIEKKIKRQIKSSMKSSLVLQRKDQAAKESDVDGKEMEKLRKQVKDLQRQIHSLVSEQKQESVIVPEAIVQSPRGYPGSSEIQPRFVIGPSRIVTPNSRMAGFFYPSSRQQIPQPPASLPAASTSAGSRAREV
ncbi:hypothetical protein GUITHDRAFT_166283, partial [Guillardia theta CCMP2712]